MNKKILLVEDDEKLALLVRDYLQSNGFEVEVVGDGSTAVVKIRRQQPALVVLDIMLPGMSGMDVCRKVRASYQGPILMLTALDDDIDQMLGLELGADDYIIKPVQPRLLLARIRTLLRRVGKSDSEVMAPIITVGSLTINTANRSVTVNGAAVTLTSAEYELLLILAQDAGQVVDRDSIVQELRGFAYDGFDRSIDRRISRLRKKLSPDDESELIVTVRGRGYQLCVS